MGKQTAKPGMPLSPREKQVLILMCQEKTGKQISRIIDLTPKTIELYLSCVYIKLDVKGRIGAAIRAAKEGWA